MDKNSDIGVPDNISLIKRILRYMNVTAFKILNRTTSISDYQSSRSWGFNAMIITVGEITIAKYILPQSIWIYRIEIFIAFFSIHLLLDYLFIKTIVTMAGNYNIYYSKFLYYIFFIFLAIGLVGAVIKFNNEIGHVGK